MFIEAHMTNHRRNSSTARCLKVKCGGVWGSYLGTAPYLNSKHTLLMSFLKSCL